jgi:hypothetical protein
MDEVVDVSVSFDNLGCLWSDFSVFFGLLNVTKLALSGQGLSQLLKDLVSPLWL